MAKRKSRFPSYGLVRGASHAQGGVAGVVAGEQPVELEGGEWIVPKEAVPDYLPVLKQITNEGRAMQEMQNGNSAMDALIASASMENGLTQPKSPMYQEGGFIKKLMSGLVDDKGLFRGESGDYGAYSGTETSTYQNEGDPARVYAGSAIQRPKEFEGEKSQFYGLLGRARDKLLERKLKNLAGDFRREYAPYGDESGYGATVKTPSDGGGWGFNLQAALDPSEVEAFRRSRGGFQLDKYKALESDPRLLEARRAMEGASKMPSSILGVPKYLAGEAGEFLQNINPFAKRGSITQVDERTGEVTRKRFQQGGPINYYQKGGVAKIEDLEQVAYSPKELTQLDSLYALMDSLSSKWVEDFGEPYEHEYGLPSLDEWTETRKKYDEDKESATRRIDELEAEVAKIPTRRIDPTGRYAPTAEEALDRLFRRMPESQPRYQKGGEVGFEQISDLSVFGDKSAMDALMASASLDSGLSQPSTAEQYWQKAAALGGTGSVGSDYLGDYMDRMERQRVDGVIPEYDREHYSGFDNFKDFKESVESGAKAKQFYETARAKRRERGISPSIQEMMTRAWENNPGGLTIRRPEERYGYQTGGQIQPRKQQEMRNPEVYGPPVPADIDSLLNQIMMRDVNQSINPFSGDSLNFEEDSLRLLGKMKKSHMPTYGRKKMQQGGVAGREAYGPPEPTGRQNIEAMQASGMLGQGQPLERRSLMGDANQDSRIAPMPMIEPDQYKMQLIPNAPQDTTMIEIPKLSSAYLPSLGVETPLSKRQNSLLQERQIAPQMLNSQVSGLIDRALVQRLANEPL